MNHPNDITSFWSWFFKGHIGKPGFSRIVNWWLAFHFSIGLLLALTIPIGLQDAANSVLGPLAGLLIGLTFAWAANAQSLLQTKEMEAISEKHPGGFTEYVYAYQLSVLIVLMTLVVWGIAGLGGFDSICLILGPKWRIFLRSLLFFLASLTIRTCWHVVLGAHMMLLIRWSFRQKNKNSK